MLFFLVSHDRSSGIADFAQKLPCSLLDLLCLSKLALLCLPKHCGDSWHRLSHLKEMLKGQRRVLTMGPQLLSQVTLWIIQTSVLSLTHCCYHYHHHQPHHWPVILEQHFLYFQIIRVILGYLLRIYILRFLHWKFWCGAPKFYFYYISGHPILGQTHCVEVLSVGTAFWIFARHKTRSALE